MPLSDENKKRIEEEEYRKHVQSQLQNSARTDINIKSDQRVETHGVGREIYKDMKEGIDDLGNLLWLVVKWWLYCLGTLLVGGLIIGLLGGRL
jgi:hypothetical protein